MKNQAGYVPVKRKVFCLFWLQKRRILYRKFYTAEAVTD